MSAFSIVFTTFILLFASEGLKLPDYITPCSRTDPNINQCALQHGREAIPKLLNGDRKYGVPQLDPFLVKEFSILISGLSLIAQDVTVEGLKDADLQDIKLDFDNLTISCQFHVPLLLFRAKYRMSGKLATLPISGKGEGNASLADVTIKYKTFCNLTKKSDGQTYLQPLDYELVLEPKKMVLHFGNLFNGNKLLGDATNNFINENFRLVLEEIGPESYKALGLIVHQILTGLLEKVPYDQLFTKDN